MEIQIIKQKKESAAKSAILKTSIRTPLVAMVLLLTLALTTLFYFSQDTRINVFDRYVEALSEYKYLESHTLRSLERSRYTLDFDSAGVKAWLMTLREIAVSVSASIEGDNYSDWFMRLDEDTRFLNQVPAFEREVLNKVAIASRYMKERSEFLQHAEDFERSLNNMPSKELGNSLRYLHGLVLGKQVSLDTLSIQDSIKIKLESLTAENLELEAIWTRLDNSKSTLLAENLIIDFKTKELLEMEWKTTLSLVFYLLSLAMLLVTLLLYVRVKHD